MDSAYGLLTTVAYKIGPEALPVYALEGSVAVAGAAVSWLKDNLSLLNSSQDAEVVAREADINDAGEVYFVPAFSGLYAPYWQQDARGCVSNVFGIF